MTTESSMKYLFNFSASYSGGGAKRLFEFARLSHSRGGASFIIHPNSVAALAAFTANRYFVTRQSQISRLVNDCAYLPDILRQIGVPDLYYSYGIPVYSRVGKINWFHVSNVLPLRARGIPLSLMDRLKFMYIGRTIRRNLRHADVISAESLFSLSLLGPVSRAKLVLSVNGSDDELGWLGKAEAGEPANVATVVGTYRYKAVGESYLVYQMLRRRNEGLQLQIIGDPERVPDSVKGDAAVRMLGFLPRQEVITRLRDSKYYISTTYVENSYNAASEGVFLSKESYISDIGPHRELLSPMTFSETSVPGVGNALLHVRRSDAVGSHLKLWEEVYSDVLRVARERMQSL